MRRVLGQQLQTDGFQIAGDAWLELARGPRLLDQYLLNEHRPIASKWQLTGQQLIQDDAQAVEITASIDFVGLAGGLLGAHIGGRAQDLPSIVIVISPASRLASPKSMM